MSCQDQQAKIPGYKQTCNNIALKKDMSHCSISWQLLGCIPDFQILLVFDV